jgi:hypothetical protein
MRVGPRVNMRPLLARHVQYDASWASTAKGIQMDRTHQAATKLPAGGQVDKAELGQFRRFADVSTLPPIACCSVAPS